MIIKDLLCNKQFIYIRYNGENYYNNNLVTLIHDYHRGERIIIITIVIFAFQALAYIIAITPSRRDGGDLGSDLEEILDIGVIVGFVVLHLYLCRRKD